MAQNTPEKSILEKLAQTQTFHPAGAKLFVPDWTLDPGDVVTVTSKKDVHDPDEEPTEYKVPIYSMDLTWNGKSRLDIQSTGNQEREPLSALRRKEYQTGRRGYGMQKEIEEETQQQYEHYTEQTDAYRKEIYRVNGVVYDSNGNIVYQTDPVTGEYILDNAGNKIPVYNPESNGSISGQVIQSAQRMATIIKQSGTVYEVFSETKQYYEGDRVLYPDSNGIPYKFINDHNPGPWKGDGEHGDVVSLGTLQSQIDNNTENFNIFYGDVNERLGTIEGSTLWGNEDELVAINGRIRVENNKVIIEEGGGIVTERTVSGRTVQSGIWDAGNLTAGTIVQTINGTTETTIRADKVNLEGYVTASYVDTAVLLADSLTSDDGYIGNIKASNINTGGNINASGAVYGSGIYITSTSEQGQTIYTDLSNAVKTIQKNDDAPDGQIGIKFNTFGNATWIPINFNIADTAKYKADVGISSVDPGNWQYDSTEHKYYNPVVATAKDSTQENPDTVTANVFIPDITLTPVVNGLTYIGKVNAWGPSVSGTVYAAADELSLYLKEKDNYVYITKTDSDPVTVGPNSNVVARMEIQGGGSEEDYNQGYADGQTNARAEISGIILNRTYTSYSDNNLSIKISGTPKLVLLSNDDPPAETERYGERLDVDATMVVRTTNASLSEGTFANGQYTITGTGGNVNVDSVDGVGGANIPVGVTPLTFTPTAAIEEGQKSVDPDFAVSGWRWDGPEGSETLGNLVVTENPYNTSLYHNVNVTLPYLSTSVTKTQTIVSARDQAMVSKVVATSNHTIDLDSIQESAIPPGKTASPLSDGCYVLNYKQGGNTTGWAYYKVSGGTVANGTISDIVLQSGNKVSYDSTRQYLKVNVQATGTNITNVPFDDSVDLAVTATEMVLQKSALTNKTIDPNNSQNTYAGQYRITRKSGGVFKAESVETVYADVAPLNFSLELNTPTSTLGGQGTANWDDTEHKYKYKLSSSLNVDNDGTVLRRETGELVLDPSQAIQYGESRVSARLTGVTTQTAYTTLEPGYYGLYRTIDSTAESTAVSYYRVTSGGTSGVKYVVSSSGEPITIWNGLSIVGSLYPNTDVITGGTDQLNRTQVTYRGRTGYVGSSYISTTKGATNYIGRIGWTDEGSDASTRAVYALSDVILNPDDTTISTHDVTVTYDDGTKVVDGARINIDASAIAGGGGGTGTVHHIAKSGSVSYSSNYKTAYFNVTAYSSETESEETALKTDQVSADISEAYEQGKSDGAGQVVTGTITALEKYLVDGYEQTYDETTHRYTIHMKASGTNISNSPYTQDIMLAANRAYNQGAQEAVTGFKYVGSAIGNIQTDHENGTITVSAMNGSTTLMIDQLGVYLVQGSWNSSNRKAVNIRMSDGSNTLIARTWVDAPATPPVSHNITASNPVARIGTKGSRVYIGSVSKARLTSLTNVWIGFTASCGDSSQSFYIDVTD